MSIVTERGINTEAEAVHYKIPEYAGICHDLIDVPEGEFRIGTSKNNFISKGFSVCSGIIIRDATNRMIGLMHIYPDQEIDTLDLNQITTRNCFTGLLIEGSAVRNKSKLISEICQTLNIRSLRNISINTTHGQWNKPFHIIYRPQKNEVLIARISHADYFKLKAF